MKDKASADTQRTEAVNCTVEITGAERDEHRGEDGGRRRQTGTERRREKGKADKRSEGNEKTGGNAKLYCLK